MANRRYVVFYDARCGLCRATRRLLERLGPDAPLRFVDVNDRGALDRWPMVDPGKAQEEVFVLTPEHRLLGGYDAVVRLLAATTAVGRAARPMLGSRPARAIGSRVYHWVSRHRHALDGILGGIGEGSSSMATRRMRPVDLLKGGLAGLLGGLAGSWVMNEFQAMKATISREMREREEARTGGAGRERERAASGGGGGEPATVKVAEAVSGAVGHDLREGEKRWAGPFVHYAFGGTMGALYGALAESKLPVTAGGGLGFAAGLWLGADEIALPALKLSGSPLRYPARVHVNALASHAVYGLIVEGVRRLLRSTLLLR